MLDLEPRVHLEEVELPVLVDDELDRTRAVVADRLRQGDGLLAHRLARVRVQERRRRLLDHLLVAALDRAFAFVQVDDIAVLVAHHLDLDVARLGDELLDEETIVAERRLRLMLRGLDRLHDLVFRMDDAQTLAAAAGRGLHHHGITDLLGDLLRVCGVLDLTDEPRNGRDLRRLRELLGFDLVAHRGDGADVRTDERDTDPRKSFRKCLALGEKAVARMHSLGARLLAGLENALDDEIGLGRRRWADQDGLVRHFHVQRFLVGFRVDGNRLDAHLAGGLDDAAGDFTAVGDEDLLEQCTPWAFLQWPDLESVLGPLRAPVNRPGRG